MQVATIDGGCFCCGGDIEFPSEDGELIGQDVDGKCNECDRVYLWECAEYPDEEPSYATSPDDAPCSCEDRD